MKEELYKGKRISLEKIDGKEVVRHPGAVVILALPDPEHVVMIKNERISVNETLWELPAGTLEKDEFPLICAKRELKEETGYQAKEIKELFSFYSTPGFCDEKITAFVATGLKLTKQKLDPDEKIEVQVISYNEAFAMIKDGRIKDGKTLLTLLHRAFF